MCVGLLGLGLTLLSAKAAQAQSLGYVLMPSAERIQWDDDLAFEEDWLYGGRLGLLFGRHVELQPFYFYRNNYPLNASRAAASFGPNAVGRNVDIRNFGANVQVNLGRGDIVPFIRGGGSVLRFEPDSGPKRDRVAVSAGGGLRFALGGLQAELFAEQMAFRLNPLNVFGADSSAAGAPTRRNFVYGAALSLPLSEFDDDALADDPLRGTTAPIEPFVGRLRYASAQGLDDQELAGVRAGIDFTPQVGLRGFYWRGVNDDRDGTAPVAGYGGEAQFNLNTGPGISPYLVLGAGRIDYHDEFRDPQGNARDDQGVLILGGGASLRLSDRLRLNAAVRDYIMTPESELTDVASTDDLTHNTMLTAGLTISIGGSSAPSERDLVARGARAERERMRARELEREREREQYRTREAERRERLDEQRRRQGDEPTMRRDRADEDDARPEQRGTRVAAPQSGEDRWITIPVPTVGEVILRYGSTASGERTSSITTTGMSLDELRRVIREELQRDSSAGREGMARVPGNTAAPGVPQPGTPGFDGQAVRQADLAEMERRITARLDAIEANRTVQVTPVPPSQVIVTDSAGQRRAATVPVFQRIGQATSRDLRPFFGVAGGDGAQAVASLRADLGPLTPGSGFRFAPELALGFGSGSPSVLALANVQYPFASFGGSSAIQPYVTLGAGIHSPSVLAVNTAVGTSFNLRPRSALQLYTYVELQGLNLFDYTRLMFGVSSRR
jgi:hypothetical protein